MTRYVDDKPSPYNIDFANSIQEHPVTQYKRSIRREKAEVMVGGAWEYYERGWVRYDSLVQGGIEAAFKAYQAGTGRSDYAFHTPGRPETYSISFASGVQTNTSTSPHTTRNVRRS